MRAGVTRSCCQASPGLPPPTPKRPEPMPAIPPPLSVTRRVISAASRCDSSFTAAASPLPMLPSKASPAITATSSFGNAVSNPAITAPNRPRTV